MMWFHAVIETKRPVAWREDSQALKPMLASRRPRRGLLTNHSASRHLDGRIPAALTTGVGRLSSTRSFRRAIT